MNLTVMLGLVFVAGQVYDFTRSGMSVGDAAFGGYFFALITFHALHVVAGMILLALNLLRSYWGDFTARSHEAVTLGAWFWFYVTGVWLVLYAALYLV
jgi:cytochrome c oxidase subunit 3